MSDAEDEEPGGDPAVVGWREGAGDDDAEGRDAGKRVQDP